jgi:hypothetical protein
VARNLLNLVFQAAATIILIKKVTMILIASGYRDEFEKTIPEQ